MSKLSFRARKIDYSKPLPVFHSDDLAEFSDQALVSRSVPLIATGVEKEEEEEHHLQAAISASQANSATPLYIPTPTANEQVLDFDQLYPSSFKLPKSNVRFNITLELLIPVTYDMDDEDEAWLMSYNEVAAKKLSEDQLETFVDQLEKLTKAKPSGQYAELPDIESTLSGPLVEAASSLYQYWRKKKEIRGGSGVSLVPSLKPDLKPHNSDPYVCFRRRETKHSRRTRRSDQQSYEKMYKLKTELERVRTLLDMSRKRDKLKKELLMLDMLVFDQRVLVREWKREQIRQQRVLEASGLAPSAAHDLTLKLSKKKSAGSNKLRISVNGSAMKAHIEETAKQRKKALKGLLLGGPTLHGDSTMEDAFRRKQIEDETFVDYTDMAFLALPHQPRKRLLSFASVSMSRFGPTIFCARRRIGRGGRIIYDRSVRHAELADFENNNARLVSYPKTMQFEVDDDSEEEYEYNENESSWESCDFKYLNPQDFSIYQPNSYMTAPGRLIYSLLPRVSYFKSVSHASPKISNLDENSNTETFGSEGPKKSKSKKVHQISSGMFNESNVNINSNGLMAPVSNLGNTVISTKNNTVARPGVSLKSGRASAKKFVNASNVMQEDIHGDHNTSRGPKFPMPMPPNMISPSQHLTSIPVSKPVTGIKSNSVSRHPMSSVIVGSSNGVIGALSTRPPTRPVASPLVGNVGRGSQNINANLTSGLGRPSLNAAIHTNRPMVDSSGTPLTVSPGNKPSLHPPSNSSNPLSNPSNVTNTTSLEKNTPTIQPSPPSSTS